MSLWKCRKMCTKQCNFAEMLAQASFCHLGDFHTVIYSSHTEAWFKLPDFNYIINAGHNSFSLEFSAMHLKGKIKMLSSFTHAHVLPTLYGFLSLFCGAQMKIFWRMSLVFFHRRQSYQFGIDMIIMTELSFLGWCYLSYVYYFFISFVVFIDFQ